jgi:hypothetical protein
LTGIWIGTRPEVVPLFEISCAARPSHALTSDQRSTGLLDDLVVTRSRIENAFPLVVLPVVRSRHYKYYTLSGRAFPAFLWL